MPRIHFATLSLATRNAKDLRASLATEGIEIGLTRSRDLLAVACGYRNFQELDAVTKAADHPPTPQGDMILDPTAAAAAFGLDPATVARCMDGLMRRSMRARVLRSPTITAELAWIRRKIGMALASAVRQGFDRLTIPGRDDGAWQIGTSTYDSRFRYLRLDEHGSIDAWRIVATEEAGDRGWVLEAVSYSSPSRVFDRLVKGMTVRAVLEGLAFGPEFSRMQARTIDGSEDEYLAENLPSVYRRNDGGFDYMALVADSLRSPDGSPSREIDLPFTSAYPVSISVEDETIVVAPAGRLDVLDFAEGLVEHGTSRSLGFPSWQARPNVDHLMGVDGSRRPIVVCHGDVEAADRFIDLSSRIPGSRSLPRPGAIEPDARSAYLAACVIRDETSGPVNVTLVHATRHGARLRIEASRLVDTINGLRSTAVTPRGLTRSEWRDRHEPTARQLTFPLERMSLSERGMASLDEIVAQGSPTAVLSIAFTPEPRFRQWYADGFDGERMRDGLIAHATLSGGDAALRRIATDVPSHDADADPVGTWRVWEMQDGNGRSPGATHKVTKALPASVPDVAVVLNFEVATLCPRCRLTEDRCLRTEAELRILSSAFDERQRSAVRHLDPAGCRECGGTGKGHRIRIVEVLDAGGYRALQGTGVPLVPELRDLVLEGRVDPAPFIGIDAKTVW